jgi:hypothetical protein
MNYIITGTLVEEESVGNIARKSRKEMSCTLKILGTRWRLLEVKK